jgi:hypothetical protein
MHPAGELGDPELSAFDLNIGIHFVHGLAESPSHGGLSQQAIPSHSFGNPNCSLLAALQ